MDELKREVAEIVVKLQEANEALDVALPALLPEAEKILEKMAPVLDKFLSTVWKGKGFDSLVIMGSASKIACELIKRETGRGIEDEYTAAKAVNIAKEIVRLSRK
jgi:hypothetical protein